jgi:mono/diheme cytochrome c family protein
MNQNEPTKTALLPAAEPRVGNASVPVWLIILLLVIFYWGMVYFDLQGGWFHHEVYSPYRSVADLDRFQPAPTEGPDLRRGKFLFDNNCALCHNTDGTGKPGQGPSYIGSEWVQGNPARLIRIPQLGLTGPIKVNGQDWTAVTSMAAMGATLTDEDLANLLSYIRDAFGNKASPIRPEDVRAVREQTANHPGPSTEAELRALPEK